MLKSLVVALAAGSFGLVGTGSAQALCVRPTAAPAVAAVAPAVRAQAAAAKKDPAPAKSVSGEVLEQWNDIGRKIIAIAEDLPEDKYDYKPNPESRTFVAQLLHASASMYYFTDPAQGKQPRYPDDPKRDDLKTKAQIVAFVKKAVQDGQVPDAGRDAEHQYEARCECGAA